MNANTDYSDYTITNFYDKDGNISGIEFLLKHYKESINSAEVQFVTLIYAVKDQRWFAETPFEDVAIALEPGRAFAIADSMGLGDKVKEILKEEGL